jgi:hypothetical protein
MKSKVLTPPRKEREGYKLLGVSVPDRVHNYLTFYAMAKGSTKSEVVKKLVYEWVNDQKEKTPDNILIQDIVQKINIRWRAEKTSQTPITFFTFKDLARQELLEKGVNETYVNLILADLEK